MKEKDVQTSIDFMVEKFQETIKKFDDFSKKLVDCVSSLRSLTLRQNDFEKIQENLLQSVSNLARQVSDSNSISTNKFQGHASAIEKAQSKVDSVGSTVALMTNSIVFMDSQIDAIKEKLGAFVTPAHLALHSSRIDAIQTETQKQITSVQSTVKENVDDHKNLKDIVTIVTQDLNSHGNALGDIRAVLRSLTDEVKTLQLTSITNYHDLKGQITQEFDKKIAAIPKPIIPSIDEATKAYQTHLDPVKLDASNAKLRSSNCEAKITLLEKKVEQLQLLLNRYQLQG